MTRKTNRPYKQVTPATVALHQARTLSQGNGTAAVENFDDDYTSPKDRAYYIAKKSEGMNTLDYIETSLQQIGADAMLELSGLVHSENEVERGRNVRYVVDQLKGKAVAKTISLTGKVNIQSVLD